MNALNMQPAAPSPGRPLRLLLVEDSPAVRALLVENLSDISRLEVAGFADTEAEAIRLLSQDAYDVVIFDIELRQGNGISVLRSLASSPRSQDILKIIFSNNVSGAYRRVGAQFGVHHFFDKTSELPRLHAILEQATQNVTLG